MCCYKHKPRAQDFRCWCVARGERCIPFKLREDGLGDLICMLANHTYFKDEFWVSRIRVYILSCVQLCAYFVCFFIQNSGAVWKFRLITPWKSVLSKAVLFLKSPTQRIQERPSTWEYQPSKLCWGHVLTGITHQRQRLVRSSSYLGPYCWLSGSETRWRLVWWRCWQERAFYQWN